MFGEYIPSGQGTVHDIYGNVRSSAVDGRSPYVTSNYGTVDTLRLQDGQKVRVSAVDGDSPYIVARSNPLGETQPEEIPPQLTQFVKLLGEEIDKEFTKRDDEITFNRRLVYGSIALNLGLIAYCIFKR